MGHIPSLPSTFGSVQSAEPEAIPIVVEDDLDFSGAAIVIEAVDAVPWGDLCHAYGPADDVREQLIAITVGDDATREVAWWNLFGNIHHQGTIYEATVRAVPIMQRLAEWSGYPDRVDALSFLAAVAEAGGVVVWRYDSGGEIAYDDERQASLARARGEDE